MFSAGRMQIRHFLPFSSKRPIFLAGDKTRFTKNKICANPTKGHIGTDEPKPPHLKPPSPVALDLLDLYNLLDHYAQTAVQEQIRLEDGIFPPALTLNANGGIVNNLENPNLLK